MNRPLSGELQEIFPNTDCWTFSDDKLPGFQRTPSPSYFGKLRHPQSDRVNRSSMPTLQRLLMAWNRDPCRAQAASFFLP